ncbi:MAG: hypothetical protein VW378_02860 [bacterium]
MVSKKQSMISGQTCRLFLKHRPYLFTRCHNSPLPFLKSLGHCLQPIMPDFPITAKAYLSSLNSSPNPLAQRYLAAYQSQHKRAYTLHVRSKTFLLADLALLACHFNIKLALFIPKSASNTDNADCRLKLITSYTIESYLPTFNFDNQLSENEQFSLLRLGPCKFTLCLLCDHASDLKTIHGPFLGLDIQKGHLPL